MNQVLQLIGALTILLPFVLLQFGRLEAKSLPYILLNTVGSGLLAALALSGRQWGFVLLEGTWALISCWGIVTFLRDRAAAPAHTLRSKGAER